MLDFAIFIFENMFEFFVFFLQTVLFVEIHAFMFESSNWFHSIPLIHVAPQFRWLDFLKKGFKVDALKSGLAGENSSKNGRFW